MYGLSGLIRIFAAIAVLCAALALSGCGGLMQGNARANQPLKTAIVNKMAAIGSAPGRGTVIRIFKESNELEVWKETAAGDYKLLKSYEICAWSGELGPKVVEGDRQAPEGFYTITRAHLNPNSSYYLAFNTSFPNKFDRAWGRTGSHLMVHGDCSSRGCYAMTDEAIAEIYAIVRESFAGGAPSVQLQLFPFRMTPANLARHADSQHLDFWRNIKEGHDRFEMSRIPPVWDVCEKRYVFDRRREASLDATGACPPVPDSDLLYQAVTKKAADDDAAMRTAVAAVEAKRLKELEAAEKAAAERAALEARGEAIGGFIGGLFGGGEAEAKEPDGNGA